MTNEERARELVEAWYEDGDKETYDMLKTRIAAALDEAERRGREQADKYCTGRFELQRDEDTGRLYWWGVEDGWKDATEIGEEGVLTLDGQSFEVGTVLRLSEPFDDIRALT